MQFNIKKKNQPNQKMGRRPKQTFLQRRHTDGQKTDEKMLNIINIREMLVKTKRYHLTPIRMAIIKKSTNNKCWRGCGDKGTLLHCWWQCQFVQPLWRTVWRFLKKTKNRGTIRSSNSTSEYLSEENENTNLKRYMHPAALFTIAKIWKQPKCPWMYE